MTVVTTCCTNESNYRVSALDIEQGTYFTGRIGRFIGLFVCSYYSIVCIAEPGSWWPRDNMTMIDNYAPVKQVDIKYSY